MFVDGVFVGLQWRLAMRTEPTEKGVTVTYQEVKIGLAGSTDAIGDAVRWHRVGLVPRFPTWRLVVDSSRRERSQECGNAGLAGGHPTSAHCEAGQTQMRTEDNFQWWAPGMDGCVPVAGSTEL